MRFTATTKGFLATAGIAALVWNALSNNLLPGVSDLLPSVEKITTVVSSYVSEDSFTFGQTQTATDDGSNFSNSSSPSSSSSTSSTTTSSTTTSSSSYTTTSSTSTTTTTFSLNTSMVPPCTTAGTHYFYNGTYHQYPNSSGVRKALLDGAYGASSHDEEPIGMLWAVSGGWGFAENQVLPTVEYLRNELGFSDARQRQQQQEQQQEQPLRWALATTPDFCQKFLQKNALPFFDALVIITKTSLRAEYPNNDPMSDGRHFHKGVKVKAMQSAPFPITTFLDVDMVPCRKDFHQILLNEAIARSVEKNRSRFEIALPNVKKSKYGQNDPRHYVAYRGDEKRESFNRHNSACVMLNTTSHRTLEMLDKYKDNFMTLDTRHTDQPALGEALLDVWESHKDDADGGFLHVDLGAERVCRQRTSEKEIESGNYFCSMYGTSDDESSSSNSSSSGSNNPCLLIHKPEKGRPRKSPKNNTTDANATAAKTQ